MIFKNKKRLIGIVLSALIIVPAALAVHLYRGLPDEPLAIGSRVPEFQVDPVRGAEPLKQQGRRVLLFFRPSCSHCQATIAQFNQLRSTHPEWFSGDKALTWALISVSDEAETNAFAESMPSWPIYQDRDRKAMTDLRAVGVPYLVLVDEKGIVQFRQTGQRGPGQQEALLNSFYQTGVITEDKR